MLPSVLQEIEREDEAWEQSRKSKPKHGRNLEATESTASTTPRIEEQVAKEKEKPKSKAPSGFY